MMHYVDHPLFGMPLQKIVNVASVPQRSPFRYPGGKTWLVPRIRRWLTSLEKRPSELVEPFCGGGIVSITVAFEGLADHVRMVELDDDLAAVWEVILDIPGGAEELARRIVDFDVNLKNVRDVLDSRPEDQMDHAFKTILRNRVNRGGILAPGTGLVKAGENGKGLLSRWYPETLKKRLLAISGVRSQLTFTHGNAFEVLEKKSGYPHLAWFIDPPYTTAAKRLYNHWEIDHRRLFEAVSTLAGDFLMTYDNDEQIQELAEEFGFETCEVAMKNTHHAAQTELLIGRDLSWHS